MGPSRCPQQLKTERTGGWPELLDLCELVERMKRSSHLSQIPTSLQLCTHSLQMDLALSLVSLKLSCYPLFSSQQVCFYKDIDDTIKVTGTELLDVATNTLFADPSPIEGMPEVYAAIAASVTSDFYYITGSPYQLYPFLHSFIQDTYPTAAGPINTKNLTLDDISSIWGFLADEDGTKNFKLAEIDRAHELFPKKTFLTVGDSSQADPEVYAES
jgi:hypothetical protein